MGFTKLDDGIIDSSIWAEPYPTRIVWVTFLAKCDSKGFVAASRSGIQRAANVTPDECNIAIKTLESPDKDSRSPEFEGRRIEKVEGGWNVLNYKKYRQHTFSDSPDAIRMREKRESEQKLTRSDCSNKKRTKTNGDEHRGTALSSASSSVSASSSGISNTPIKESVDDDKRAIVPDPTVVERPAVATVYDKLAVKLRDYIKATGSDMVFKEKYLPKWANTFRLMVERDKRTVEAIKKKMDAIFEDKFWCTVIRCADTLRERWNEGKLDKMSESEGSSLPIQESTQGGIAPYPGYYKTWKKLTDGWEILRPGEWKESHIIPGIGKENEPLWVKAWEIMQTHRKEVGLDMILKIFQQAKDKDNAKTGS